MKNEYNKLLIIKVKVSQVQVRVRLELGVLTITEDQTFFIIGNVFKFTVLSKLSLSSSQKIHCGNKEKRLFQTAQK